MDEGNETCRRCIGTYVCVACVLTENAVGYMFCPQIVLHAK